MIVSHADQLGYTNVAWQWPAVLLLEDVEMDPAPLPGLAVGSQYLRDGLVNTAQYLLVVGGHTLRAPLGQEHWDNTSTLCPTRGSTHSLSGPRPCGRGTLWPCPPSAGWCWGLPGLSPPPGTRWTPWWSWPGSPGPPAPGHWTRERESVRAVDCRDSRTFRTKITIK